MAYFLDHPADYAASNCRCQLVTVRRTADLQYSSPDLDSSPDLSPFLLDLDSDLEDFGSKDLNLDLKTMDLDLDSDLEVLPASHFFKSFLCLQNR